VRNGSNGTVSGPGNIGGAVNFGVVVFYFSWCHLRRRNHHKIVAIRGRQRNGEPGIRAPTRVCL
jgi:hypothetical protein